ncbi:MAG TPA: hypothetical protein VIX59_18370, partial [Candidatus Binataceae bacterium]
WLWTSSREREEWNRVQTLVAGGRTAMLAQVCGGELLAPQFDKPVAAFLIPEESTAGDVARKAEQVAAADFVVMATNEPLGDAPEGLLKDLPQLRQAMSGTRLAWQGEYFRVYSRERTDAGKPQPAAHPAASP